MVQSYGLSRALSSLRWIYKLRWSASSWNKKGSGASERSVFQQKLLENTFFMSSKKSVKFMGKSIKIM